MSDPHASRKYRKHVRLREFDYATPGVYFVTICTSARKRLFGEIRDGEMHRSRFGEIADLCWRELPRHYTYLMLDAFVIMPDHVHGILMLCDEPVNCDGAGLRPAGTDLRRHSLSEIVRAFKGFSTRKINELRGTPGKPVWQQNFFERVLRGEKEYHSARVYIENNVMRQHLESENNDNYAF